jgi:hypothetical protein
MKKAFLSEQLAGLIAAALVIPSLYFVISAFLNYGLGISGPWSVIEPIFNQPQNKSLGLNINLLIVFGPIAACLISLFQVLQLDWKLEKERLHIKASLFLKSYHWIIIGASLFCICSMLLYFLGENCNCH